MTEPLLLLGDCLERLRDLEDASVDSIVTDPPYGLGKEPDTAEVLTAWLDDRVYVATGAGFMGKEWDAFVPDLAVWRECFRVLKPGGHLLAFSGTRTVDLVGIGIRLAGFERRDLLAWLYASGFPKSHDVSKAIDAAAGAEREVIRERTYEMTDGGGYSGGLNTSKPRSESSELTAPATDEARRWEGWGTALKPALEPIVVARKPLAGTVAANVLAHGVGALNIDGCRIATADALGGGAEVATTAAQKGNDGWTRPWMDDEASREAHAERVRANVQRAETLGRWPANVALGHADACVLVGERQVVADGHWPAARPAGSELAGASGHAGQAGLEERDARSETVEVWECSDDCPVRLLDEQTGVLRSGQEAKDGHRRSSDKFSPGVYGTFAGTERETGAAIYGDAGGASRFFYTAKASQAERHAGLDGFEPRFAPTMGNGIGGKEHDPETATKKRNIHPTVKPVALMRWLVRLVTPPGGRVLDPYLGSGTTGIACALEGFAFVGIERDPDYLRIAEGRIRFWAEHGDEALRIVAEREQADQRRREVADAGQLDIFAAGGA